MEHFDIKSRPKTVILEEIIWILEEKETKNRRKCEKCNILIRSLLLLHSLGVGKNKRLSEK